MSKGQHLYLVLDDWFQGYSIRKINLWSTNTCPQLKPVGLSPTGAICMGVHSLPSASFCFQAPSGKPKSIAGAFGNKILVWFPEDSGTKCTQQHVIVHDIHEHASIRGPEPWKDMLNAIFIPVGDRLFALSDSSFGVLPSPPPAYDDANWENFVWSWSELPKPTFQCDMVTSYAVHPDGHSIFVTAVKESIPSTFSCDVAVPETRWRQHGLWHLPFTGRGYFDPELDAWIGLSGDLYATGRICSCDVVDTDSEDIHQQCPALKFSKEKLFSEVPAEMHIGATLVCMGGGSKYCLLEAIYIKAGRMSDSEDSGGKVNEKNRFLRLTTFSLKYDKNGDLTTGNSRRVSYCSVPHKVTDAMLEYPVAFWM